MASGTPTSSGQSRDANGRRENRLRANSASGVAIRSARLLEAFRLSGCSQTLARFLALRGFLRAIMSEANDDPVSDAGPMSLLWAPHPVRSIEGNADPEALSRSFHASQKITPIRPKQASKPNAIFAAESRLLLDAPTSKGKPQTGHVAVFLEHGQSHIGQTTRSGSLLPLFGKRAANCVGPAASF